jgi:hypothetical protein
MPCDSASKDAKFPAKDPEYNAENERKYLQKVIYENLPKLEKQGHDFLSKDFDPGNNTDYEIKCCTLSQCSVCSFISI